MNLFDKLLRVTIYSIFTCLFIACEFYALWGFCFWVLSRAYSYYESMNFFVFYIVVIGLGAILVRVLYAILMVIADVVIKILSRITPYFLYGLWLTRIVSIICCVIFVFFALNGVTSIFIGFIAVVMSILAIIMVRVNIITTKAELLIRDTAIKLGITDKEVRNKYFTNESY